MTYCVGLRLEQGLVMAADSRTNAGVDYISSFSKLHVMQPAPDRIFVLLAAGSLATTQNVLNRINRDLRWRLPSRWPSTPAIAWRSRIGSSSRRTHRNSWRYRKVGMPLSPGGSVNSRDLPGNTRKAICDQESNENQSIVKSS